MQHPLKVLMLEDSLTDLEIIQRELRKTKQPFIFHHAIDKKEFLKALDGFPMDIILSDNSLPQFSAKEALEIIHKRKLEVPFVIVTGTMSEDFAASIIKLGADDYILKDRLARLPAAIDAALQKRKVEREKAEALQSLVKSEEQYRNLVERISDGFVSLDRDLTLTYVNKVAADILQQAHINLLGMRFYDLFPEAVGGPIFNAFKKAIDTNRNVYVEEYSAALGKWIMGSIYPNESGVSVYFKDITEQKKLEAELQEQKRIEQLHLTAAALEAQEKERNSIGQELHDNVNQILVGTSMLLSLIRENPENIPRLLPKCMDYIKDAINENRKIAHELVTPDIDKNGLLEQIRRLSETILETNNLKVIIKEEEYNETLLSKKLELSAYRIIQEQCTNILKHAKASNVTIELSTAGGKAFRMNVSDDGQGVAEGKKISGIGLGNIESRLSVLSGSMVVKTAPGKGFTLAIEIPLQ